MPLVGKWLSLVEHSVRDAGVGGSNPLFPTKINNETSRIDSRSGFIFLLNIPFLTKIKQYFLGRFIWLQIGCIDA